MFANRSVKRQAAVIPLNDKAVETVKTNSLQGWITVSCIRSVITANREPRLYSIFFDESTNLLSG